MQNIESHLQALREILIPAANPANAAPMSAYMKGLFPFLGLKKPERASLSKEWIQIAVKRQARLYPTIAHRLWEMPEREYQYIALDLISKSSRFWQEDLITLCEELIVEKSWWDTVDLLAASILGKYFLKHPELLEEKTRAWSASSNLWLNRTAILVQLKFKSQTREDLLLSVIRAHCHSKEFFIQKSIGWVLREYARTNPEWVLKTCESLPLAALSKREALKHIG